MSEVKNLTIRLSPEEYSQAKHLADQRRISLNQLVKEGLRHLETEAREQSLYDDFTLLGEDQDEASVEFAVDAQSEIVETAS